MSIKSKNLVTPFFLAMSLSASSFVMAEAVPTNTSNHPVKSIASNTANNTAVSSTDSNLITPRLEDGQAAFNTGNYDLAFSLWQTLATQGHSDAQVFVGLSYANGWGVDKNTKLASHWYQKAANNDNASAQFLLGLYFVSGSDADLPTGVMWLQRAADNGDSSAKRFLKKAKKRGWFNKVPKIEQEPKYRKVETVALAENIQ